MIFMSNGSFEVAVADLNRSLARAYAAVLWYSALKLSMQTERDI